MTHFHTKHTPISAVLGMMLLLFVGSSSAQLARSFPGGLGIELGAGHNQLFWDVKGSDVSGDRLEFSLTPTARVTYLLMVAEPFDLVPFVGFNRFGGKSSEKPSGYKDEYWFDAIEMGLSGQYHIDHIRIGVGLKVNWHISATVRSFGSAADPTGSNRSWNETDLLQARNVAILTNSIP